MPKCQWRERPTDEQLCNTLADPGKLFCPRHEFLAEQREQKRIAKALEKESGVVSNPRDRTELLKRGYHYTGNGICRGCNQQVEWYNTPSGKSAPYNPMPIDTSPAVCHFATCTRANQFRRAS